MAKDPAFLFYPGDWLGGTITFSRHEKGAYMDLLVAQFNSYALSLEDIRIILNSDYELWDRKLRNKFKGVDPDGRLYNIKLREEQDRRASYTETRRNNRKPNHMNNHMSEHMSEHMETETETENINVNVIKKETNKKVKEIINKPEQTLFLDQFSGMYEQVTGHPFKCDKKHYVMTANLIKQYSYDQIVEKTKILAIYCEKAEVWFCKNGWSDFTPETLVTHWNRLVPILNDTQKKQKQGMDALAKAKEDRRKADELLKK